MILITFLSTFSEIQKYYDLDFEQESKELHRLESEYDEPEKENERIDYTEERSSGHDEIADIFSSFLAME